MGEPCLWGFASFGGPRLVGAVSICKLWSGSRVYEDFCYGDLQLWSAVTGLVWWEPCLWGFAALVGSSGPRLVSFGRQ